MLIRYRTAHLAQSLGFDEPVDSYFQKHYYHQGKLIKKVEITRNPDEVFDDKRITAINSRKLSNSTLPQFCIARPTQSELQTWLSNRGINITISINDINYEKVFEKTLVIGLKLYKKYL